MKKLIVSVSIVLLLLMATSTVADVEESPLLQLDSGMLPGHSDEPLSIFVALHDGDTLSWLYRQS